MILVITPKQLNLDFYLIISNAHYQSMSHRKCHTADQLVIPHLIFNYTKNR